MPDLGSGRHLDFACGYATFLAELGWRFPEARLIGLNIDFEGVHASAAALLGHAGVEAELVEGDAREMPFADASFDSVSCFMGLQDIELAFGVRGVREALRESIRVLGPGGVLCLVDEYRFEQYDVLLDTLAVEVDARAERELDAKWDRDVAECAIALYSEGWLEQKRLGDSATSVEAAAGYARNMRAEVERQLSARGYFVPFGPVRAVVCRKVAGGSPGSPPN
jgi:SAM-dependent methyltransferase